MANIRRQDPAACAATSAAAVDAIEDELVEDANECAMVKQEIMNATTPEEVELAAIKAQILCN